MLLRIPALFAKPVLMASTHGLHDLQHERVRLLAYPLALVPLPFTTHAFLIASVRHFSHDVGVWPSLLVHLLWGVFFSAGREVVAWSTFTAFYVVMHALPRLRLWYSKSRVQACVAIVCVFCASLLVSGGLVVDETVQRMIVVHVSLDEMNRTGQF